jgi:hypothetical protein
MWVVYPPIGNIKAKGSVPREVTFQKDIQGAVTFSQAGEAHFSAQPVHVSTESCV